MIIFVTITQKNVTVLPSLLTITNKKNITSLPIHYQKSNCNDNDITSNALLPNPVCIYETLPLIASRYN